MDPRNTATDRIAPALLSLPAASAYLGGDISLETIRTWTRRGVLRPIRIGRRLFVSRAEIDALIARQIGAAS